jgi:hypothetical protein
MIEFHMCPVYETENTIHALDFKNNICLFKTQCSDHCELALELLASQKYS